MGQAGSLILGTLLSSVGFGYFVYGKKQNNMIALVAGVFLMVLPYLVSNSFFLIGISILLMLLPRFISL